MILFHWLVGTGANGNEDGIGGDCQFSQPTGMCNEGNTLFVIDSGSKKCLNCYITFSTSHIFVSSQQTIQSIFCTF